MNGFGRCSVSISGAQNSRSGDVIGCVSSLSGIVLVHDLSNWKSKQNLRKWLAEVLNMDSGNTSVDE